MSENKATHLIAEIGNMHLGNFTKAKEMIKVAKDCGATLVKFQAFEPKDVAKHGSMPSSFYNDVAFSFEQYLILIEMGTYFNIPVFFSTFSESMQRLWVETFFHKVSAKQAVDFEFNEFSDKSTTFVSVNEDYGDLPALSKSKVMFASKYLEENVDLFNIGKLSEIYQRQVGYSDHTKGIETCYRAVREHNAGWVEKHFMLEQDKNFSYTQPNEKGGTLFRDSVHSATPDEFEKLAKLIL